MLANGKTTSFLKKEHLSQFGSYNVYLTPKNMLKSLSFDLAYWNIITTRSCMPNFPSRFLVKDFLIPPTSDIAKNIRARPNFCDEIEKNSAGAHKQEFFFFFSKPNNSMYFQCTETKKYVQLCTWKHVKKTTPYDLCTVHVYITHKVHCTSLYTLLINTTIISLKKWSTML